VLPAGYMEYIGLEAEAASMAGRQAKAVPGLFGRDEGKCHGRFSSIRHELA